MAEANSTHKIVIPIYDPDSPNVTAKTWVAMVDMAVKAAGTITTGVGDAAVVTPRWSAQMTANHAILLLRNKASQWIETLIEEGNEAVNDWAQLKVLFKARFCARHTLSEKVNLMDLLQRKNESVQDFLDRVRANLSTLYSTEWSDAEDAAARTKSMAMHVKLNFAAGLRPSIRQQAVIQDSKTVEELLTIAMRVEAALKDNSRQSAPEVHAIAEAGRDEVDDYDPDVDGGAVSAVGARTGARSRNFRGRGGGSNNGPPRSAAGSTRFQGTCNYCFKQFHKSEKCFKRQNDERRGIRRDNINAPTRQASAVEAEDDSREISSVELQNYLNGFSA